MPQATPWREHVTADQRRFTCLMPQDRFSFAVGMKVPSGSSLCYAQAGAVRIFPDTRNKRLSHAVDPYELPLPHWTAGRVPRVYMHPFALCHLFATGELYDLIIAEFVRNMGDAPYLRGAFELTMPSVILTKLGTNSAILVVDTRLNLSVR